MANNYRTLSTDYLNTGGHCMVTTMTVYDQAENKQLFVYVSDEALTVNTVDFLRMDIEYSESFQLYSLDCSEWTVEPDPLNQTMNNLPFEIYQLLSSCLHQHIKNTVKEFKQPYKCNWRQLPFQLVVTVDDVYAGWLDENDKLIMTDGEKIILDEDWLKMFNGTVATGDLEIDDDNLTVANNLKAGLDNWMPQDNDDEEEWDCFYNGTVQLIVNNQLYTFYNEAIVYQALLELADTIIDDKK